MIFLGIDPGFDRVGFGVVELQGNNRKYLASGVITTSRAQDFYSRLVEIQEDLQQICKTYNPSIACIETLFFSKNTKTAMKVAEARGGINTYLYKSGLVINEVSPNTIKSALTGDGRADKKQVEFMVKKSLNLPNLKAIDDACDALAMAIYASYNCLPI